MDSNHRAMSAFAVIAIVLLCAFAPSVSADGVSEYTIDMRTGDVFSYSPTTTLPASFESAPEVAGVTWDASKRTMSATFSEENTEGVQVVIVAKWTSSDGSISQEARQAIDFRTFGHLTMTCDATAAVPVGTSAGSVVVTPTVGTPDGTRTVLSCDLKENPHIAWNPSENAVVTKAAITNADSATYSFTITATNTSASAGSTLRAETLTAEVSVSVGSDLAIVGGDMETYIGCTDSRNTWAVRTNMDDVAGAEIVRSIEVPSDVPEGLVVSNENGTIVIDPSKAELAGADSKTYTFTAKASVTDSDGTVSTAERQISVTVWKDLTYLTVPTLTDVTLKASSKDARTVTLTASVTRAAAVTVDWGDGKEPVRAVISDGRITCDKTFDDSGRHVVTVTAVNGSGISAVHYLLYDASTGYFQDYEPPEESHAFPVWLVFLLLAGMFAALYLVFGFRHPVVLFGLIASGLLALAYCIGWL